MKIPREVRIGGVDYKVEYVENLNDGTNICYGHISFEDCTIGLHSTNQAHQKQCLTLWHEILHGIAYHANLKIEGDDENVIDILAKGVYQVLQDNGKKLFDISERGDSVD